MASQKTTNVMKFPPALPITTNEQLRSTYTFDRSKGAFGIFKTSPAEPTANVATAAPNQTAPEEKTLSNRNAQNSESTQPKVRKRKAEAETTENVNKENREPAPKRQKVMATLTESVSEYLASESPDDLHNSLLPFITTEAFREKSRALLLKHGHDSKTCGCGKDDTDAVDKDQVDQVFVLAKDQPKNTWVSSSDNTLLKDVAITLKDGITPLYFQDQFVYNTPIAENRFFPVYKLVADKKALTCKLVALEPNDTLERDIKKRRDAYYAKMGFEHCQDTQKNPVRMYGPDQCSVKLSDEIDVTDENAVVQYANDSFFVKDLPLHRMEIDHNINEQTSFIATYDLNPEKTCIVRTVITGSSYQQSADSLDEESGENTDGDIFYRGELAVEMPRTRVEREIVDTMSRKVMASYALNEDGTITRTVQTLKDCPVNGESEEKLVTAASTATTDDATMDAEEPAQTTEAADSDAKAQSTDAEKSATKEPVKSSSKVKSVAVTNKKAAAASTKTKASSKDKPATKPKSDNAKTDKASTEAADSSKEATVESVVPSAGFTTRYVKAPISTFMGYFSKKTT